VFEKEIMKVISKAGEISVETNGTFQMCVAQEGHSKGAWKDGSQGKANCIQLS